jgi:hypothetical protein
LAAGDDPAAHDFHKSPETSDFRRNSKSASPVEWNTQLLQSMPLQCLCSARR